MMKRSGLQLRQLDGQGPYSSRALRAFTSTRTAPPVSSSGASAAPPAAAICLQLEAAPLTATNNNICSGNSASSYNSLEEVLPTAMSESAAAESISYGAKAVDCYSTPKVRNPAWRWNCFTPRESWYTTDVSIDVEKHHTPKNFTDKLAYYTVQILKILINFFFQRQHMCHAKLLETVAAIPGMVGAILLHLKSLRRFEHSGGWIEALLEEAENERMHLVTFIELVKPKWYERALLITLQWAFFNAYFLAYVVSPQLAHRLTGYLEEEAVTLYTEFLKDIDNGSFQNIPAPQVAIDYWRLTPDSTLRDVVVVIRADEAHHRDLNHYASDIYCQGHELKGGPLRSNWIPLISSSTKPKEFNK